MKKGYVAINKDHHFYNHEKSGFSPDLYEYSYSRSGAIEMVNMSCYTGWIPEGEEYKIVSFSLSILQKKKKDAERIIINKSNKIKKYYKAEKKIDPARKLFTVTGEKGESEEDVLKKALEKLEEIEDKRLPPN